ncbi:MAG: Do family serine endopeptidase [Armatimonadetes bacterium]|nr:Do family serine endopeptidase [Armatimonadota bacterium]
MRKQILSIITLAVLFSFFQGFAASASLETLKELEGAFSSIAEKVGPSVVNISAEKTVSAHPQMPDLEPFRGTPWEDFFRRFFGGIPGPQRPQTSTSLGSGVIVRSDGYILTNEHVIQGATEIRVYLSGKKEALRGKIVGQDPKTDIALIKVDSSAPLVAAVLGDSDRITIGSWALAFGNPFGVGSTMTLGIISAKGRDISSGEEMLRNLIQTDASINPGNSGGPLVNLEGEVIGVSTAILSPTGGSVGIGLAIPINVAREILPQLIEKGKVTRGWLGVAIRDLDEGLSRRFGTPTGVLINDVQPDGPAARAGLQPGDVVVEFDGKAIKDTLELQNQVARTPPGKRAAIKAMREKALITLTVTVGEAPAAPSEAPSPQTPSLLGLRVAPVTEEVVRRYRLKSREGVIVIEASPGSQAARAGITHGDIVIEVNNKKIRGIADWQKATGELSSDTPVVLRIIRGGRSLYLTVQ